MVFPPTPDRPLPPATGADLETSLSRVPESATDCESRVRYDSAVIAEVTSTTDEGYRLRFALVETQADLESVRRDWVSTDVLDAGANCPAEPGTTTYRIDASDQMVGSVSCHFWLNTLAALTWDRSESLVVGMVWSGVDTEIEEMWDWWITYGVIRVD